MNEHHLTGQQISAKVSAPSVDDTLKERGNRYGTFSGHAEISIVLKKFIERNLKSRNKELPAYQQEALDMICHKIARIINGDNNYADSWHDIAGYAKLVDDILNGKNP